MQSPFGMSCPGMSISTLPASNVLIEVRDITAECLWMVISQSLCLVEERTYVKQLSRRSVILCVFIIVFMFKHLIHCLVNKLIILDRVIIDSIAECSSFSAEFDVRVKSQFVSRRDLQCNVGGIKRI